MFCNLVEALDDKLGILFAQVAHHRRHILYALMILLSLHFRVPNKFGLRLEKPNLTEAASQNYGIGKFRAHLAEIRAHIVKSGDTQLITNAPECVQKLINFFK
ncbi:hypothetical protein niasHT_005728 [Heterodera trifolii]|uniref:Uncharacterized protein n=1 Tax=Heterodera trifolii TaxID=157864 RepID=A0ABD2LYU7_9BILA